MDQITFVCVLGIGTVFVGLICIVILCSLVSFLCRKLLSDKKDVVSASNVASVTTVAAAAPAPSAPIADRKKILAAVCAVIAEENGCEVNAIRVLSFKKIERKR